METIRCDLPTELKSIEIHTFADLHIGDMHCDIKAIKERIDYVTNTPNAYLILNGDLMNNATKTSVSDSYAESIQPMEQIKRCVELFGGVKDKILCVTSGNHENRTYIKEGIDITALFCAQLNIMERYSKTGALLFVRFGTEKKHGGKSVKRRQQCYTIYCTHGSGGGRKEGSKAVRLADMASIVDADIYIHSHTHLPMIMKQGFYRIDRHNSTVGMADKLFVNTSAMLDYGGYGEAFEFKPSSKDTPVIYLSGVRKQMTAKL